MNIIILNDYAAVQGGAAQVAVQSGLGLAQQGHKITFVFASGEADSLLEHSNIQCICLNQYDLLNNPSKLNAAWKGLWNRQVEEQLKLILNDFDPINTIVHIHSWVKALSISAVACVLRKHFPMVMTLHDYFSVCPNGGFYNYRHQQICNLKPMSMACLISIIMYNVLQAPLKFIINIIFAFLFYWYGYTRMGLSKYKFIKYNLLFSIPIVLIGIFEIIGILGIDYFYSLVTEFRNIILTVNLGNERLHLLFSEPSFLGTYLLFFIFLIHISLLRKTQKLVAFSFIFIVFALGNSLNSIIILFSFLLGYYFFYYKKNIFFKLIMLLLFLILLSVIAYVIFGNRLLNISSDPSGYIRLLHLVVLTNMFIDSYGLGMGFGEFSNYFINYISSIDLVIHTDELLNNLDGEGVVVPYSMFFSILGQMGILGTGAFLYLFKSIFSKYNQYKHYQLALFVATLSALPWGLPFIWVLLGMIDKEIEERKIENITHNRG